MKVILKSTLYITYFIIMYLFVFGILIFKVHMPAMASFEYDVEAMMHADEHHNHYAYLVEDRQQAFDVRLAMIDEAQSQIDITYYVIHTGVAQTLFYGALLSAADRGVRVRLIIDWLFYMERNHLTESDLTVLSMHPNIEVKLYEPFSLQSPYAIQNRLHDKFIVVDNTYALIGGRNIGDRYFFDFDAPERMTQDRDVLIFGKNNQYPPVLAMSAYYELLFNYENSRTLDAVHSNEKRADTLKNDYVDYRSLQLTDQLLETLKLNATEVDNITFLRSPLARMQKSPVVFQTLVDISEHYEAITIQSPYIILSKPMHRMLPQNPQHEYTILTNSMAVSPNFLAASGYLNNRKLLAEYTNLYEYQNPTSLHTKTVLMGDNLTVIGSLNLDPRSAFLSTESVVVIISEDFNAQVRLVNNDYFDNSLRVLENGDYVANENVTLAPQNRLRHMAMKLFSYLSYLFPEML